jgi:Right handed beta helix region
VDGSRAEIPQSEDTRPYGGPVDTFRVLGIEGVSSKGARGRSRRFRDRTVGICRSWRRVTVVAVGLATILAATSLSGEALAAVCRPGSRNTDRDHLPDCWERRNGLVVGRRDHLTDKDRDGLLAIQEFRLDAATGGVFGPYRANDANSDNDGGFDKFGWTFPTKDGWEDFDGDGFINTAERVWRTNPGVASSTPVLPATGCVGVPNRVAHDGSANVTLLLQAVLDTVPDGGCLRLHLNGRYRHNGTLRIVGRDHLTIDGNHATLFTTRPGPVPAGAANSERPHVFIWAGQDVTIENITIDGPNRDGVYREAYEAEHGFNVKGAVRLTIRNSTVRQVYGDFVYLDDTQWPIHSGVMVPTTDLLVSGNTFRVAGRHGLGVSGNSVGVRFENNSVKRVFRSGIDIEMHPDRSASQFEIVGNTFEDVRHNWIAAGEGSATDIYVGFNTILGDSMHAKMAPRTVGNLHERWTFEGNVSDTNNPRDRPVFTMARARDFTFIQNVQPMGGGGRVFFLYVDVCGVTLIDNQFTDYAVLFDPADPPPF